MPKSDLNLVDIPSVHVAYPAVDRDYPISPGENLMRAFNHEKPMWMPIVPLAGNTTPRDGYGDVYIDPAADGFDWFGIEYKYSETQKSSTPQGNVITEIVGWQEKINWPNLEEWDYSKGIEKFKRDDSLATTGWYGYGLFEKLHSLEGFEQALVDLILETDECRAFFERMADHKARLFKGLNDVYNMDYITYGDDWGTARAPFFSMDIFEKTLLEPTKRLVASIQNEGMKVLFHNCGLINDFIPHLVEDIKADCLMIQSINDLEGIIKKYGDRVTIYTYLDLEIMYNPKYTEEDVRQYARSLVDKYGAHVNPGSGLMVMAYAKDAETFYAFEDELYNYSLEKY